ncbi:MAG: hypothetical protein R3A47_12570, partial [Polyangiales bacterium]
MNSNPLAEQKRLLSKTRTFARDDAAQSWRYTLITFALLVIGYAVLFSPLPLLLRLAVVPVVALLLVRAFILFHDYQHGSILRGSKSAEALFATYGMWILTPPKVWRYTHDYHH